MASYKFTVVGHSADLKTIPTQSKDTGIFLPPDLVEFLGDLNTLSFTIYKDDCIKALTALIYSLPLYSNKGGKIIVHKDGFEEFKSLLKDIEVFFGDYAQATYTDFKPNETTQGRNYLYGLAKPGGFNIRKFFIADYTDITIDKDAQGKFHLHFENRPVFRSHEVSSIEEEEHGKDHSSSLMNQTIFYGAPGTGKSFKIDTILKEKSIPQSDVIRITFHQDYSYSEFVGGLRPEKNGNSIKYEYKGGPFAEALQKSFVGDTYLVIEEINRGNPAAIFGDIFQLLDRDKDGKSKYSITNADLYHFLIKDERLQSLLEKDKIYLPSGLHILCTMNTADQNVFILDTAFKRRFKMEYIPINLDVFSTKPELAPYLEETEAFEGDVDLEIIIENTSIYGLPKELKRNWPTFAAVVNGKIDAINRDEGDQISEDKKLGPFFVGIDEIQDRKKFADKVLYYLKQDVFKYVDHVLPDSYEVLVDKYVNKKEDIFGLICLTE